MSRSQSQCSMLSIKRYDRRERKSGPKLGYSKREKNGDLFFLLDHSGRIGETVEVISMSGLLPELLPLFSRRPSGSHLTNELRRDQFRMLICQLNHSFHISISQLKYSQWFALYRFPKIFNPSMRSTLFRMLTKTQPYHNLTWSDSDYICWKEIRHNPEAVNGWLS